MATIQFKAKIRPVYYAEEDSPAYHAVDVPKLNRKHCDMQAFHNHKKYGPYANSDLFPSMLAKIRRDMAGNAGVLKLENLPENVTVDASGFLAIIRIEV